MKFGRPLAIIVHYTVQFNLGCCKNSVSDMDPNTIQKIKKIIIIRHLKIGEIQNIQFNLECCNIQWAHTMKFGKRQSL